MVNNERMVRDFVNAITDEVNQRREEIERSSTVYVAGELKAAEAEILEEVYSEVNRKSSEIKGSVGREISAEISECRGAVLRRRSELAEGVFAEVEQKIRDFTKSEQYEAFMLGSAENAVKLLAGNSTILVREADMFLADKITAAVGCPVETSDSIILGGIMAKSGDIIADDTLDARFYAEKEAFRENYKIEI